MWRLVCRVVGAASPIWSCPPPEERPLTPPRVRRRINGTVFMSSLRLMIPFTWTLQPLFWWTVRSAEIFSHPSLPDTLIFLLHSLPLLQPGISLPPCANPPPPPSRSRILLQHRCGRSGSLWEFLTAFSLQEQRSGRATGGASVWRVSHWRSQTPRGESGSLIGSCRSRYPGICRLENAETMTPNMGFNLGSDRWKGGGSSGTSHWLHTRWEQRHFTRQKMKPPPPTRNKRGEGGRGTTNRETTRNNQTQKRLQCHPAGHWYSTPTHGMLGKRRLWHASPDPTGHQQDCKRVRPRPAERPRSADPIWWLQSGCRRTARSSTAEDPSRVRRYRRRSEDEDSLMN